MTSVPSTDLHCARTSKATLIEDRKRYFPSSLVLSHARIDPLQAVSGKGDKIYDENGNEYLDTRNNVPILGHADLRVVDAVARQMSLITTNTRYLHPSLSELAAELSSILPPKLCKFFFVNSGSEANDLALRLARYHTGSTRVIAQTQAYHGITLAAMAVSECKFRAPFVVKEEWVDIVNVPDLLNGEHDSLSPYIAEVEAVCNRHSGDVSAMILESVVSVGGGIFQPPGYMSSVFSLVRETGGVCICDETQVGLGRLGTWWGFEFDGSEEAVPDILTIGKQLGNGFPVAAVVTTEEIAASLEETKIEVFSTFGGSTVSCAAAVATIRALREDRLMENARDTGMYLIAAFREQLAPFMPEIVRDIRGHGLYIAVQLANGDIAKHMNDALYKDWKILSTLDGPDDNVMIVKPPLCFSLASCDRFVLAIVQILKSLERNPV